MLVNALKAYSIWPGGRCRAMSAICVKGELQDYYKRKVGEGKNKMLVLNAVRNNGTAHAANSSNLLSSASTTKI